MAPSRASTAALALAVTATLAAGVGAAAPSPATARALNAAAPQREPQPPRAPTKIGYGGAVTSVDPNASAIGLQVLKSGGNAVDAAVAMGAALGVVEPYSAGIGGGGYFVSYDAKTQRVSTIDGRETAPAAMPRDAFIDPETGDPYPFTPQLVTSGVAVGVPGTLATWQRALSRWGTRSLAQSLAPSAKLARKGFVVDQTFRDQTIDNRQRFQAFTTSKNVFLRHGAPQVGTRFTNKHLADTYDEIARRGAGWFYRGELGKEVARTTRRPPVREGTDLPVPKGFMTRADLAGYRALFQRPTQLGYRGYDVYGMRPSSSGGSTVGEALNILEKYDVAAMDDIQALHHYLEAAALAFADRGAYLGDKRFVDVPLGDLLSDDYAAERACLIDPDQALPKPTAAGDVTSYDGQCGGAKPATQQPAEDTENISTTNLTVADKWGNVVEYTLTIEQTGGSGIVVPGRGFLLNNELTDFTTVYAAADPNRIQPGKRPRSSMSPTIVLKDGKPFLALGSPGGSTIITTVLQTLFNRIDRGMTIQQAIAAPRAAPSNKADVSAEPAFIDAYGDGLKSLGHSLVPSGDTFTSASQIGAATAIEFGPGRLLTAVAEPTRRGGGSAKVVRPAE